MSPDSFQVSQDFLQKLPMTNALQEQLLKAGLATEDQMRKPARPKSKSPAKNRKKKPARNKPAAAAGSKNNSDIDLRAAYAERRRDEQRAEEEARALAALRKANKLKVNKLIESNAQDTTGGTISYQFLVGKNIKKLWVTEPLRDALVAGELGITFLGGKRCVIPKSIADEINVLDPKKIIVIHKPEDGQAGEAEFAVPDDLMW